MVVKQGSGARKMAVLPTQLRLLQAFRARPAGGQGRDDLHLPLPVLGGLERQVACDLVLEGRDEDLARLDDRRRDAAKHGRMRCRGHRTQHALGRKHRINGTPAVLFEDGRRVPGAIPVAEVEKRLVEAAQPGKS